MVNDSILVLTTPQHYPFTRIHTTRLFLALILSHIHLYSPPWLCLCSHSEFRGGPCRLAPLLAAPAVLGAAAQLHGPPVGGRGGHQHGPADPAQLRGEPAETVLLVGHRLLLHHLPPLRHLLEHLRVRAPGGTDPASSLMTTPPPPPCPRLSFTNTLTPTLLLTKVPVQPLLPIPISCPRRPKWKDTRSFKLKYTKNPFFTDTLQIKEKYVSFIKEGSQ